MNEMPGEFPGSYHKGPEGGYVECNPEFVLYDEQRALDLIACCGEHGSQKLLIHAMSFPDDFYDLHTGLAGQILLKMSMYKILMAAVIPSEKIGTGRFYEMVIETNRGKEFRVFSTELEAIQWLSGK
jgi:PadR family transcriptional regulator AphA